MSPCAPANIVNSHTNAKTVDTATQSGFALVLRELYLRELER